MEREGERRKRRRRGRRGRGRKLNLTRLEEDVMGIKKKFDERREDEVNV